MISSVGGLDESLWYLTLGEPMLPRASLENDIEADVCILGAGYSGLWTALFLKQKQPSLKVVVLEAAMAGEGASGRNGGWLMGSFGGDLGYLAQLDGEARRRAKARITGTVARAANTFSELGIQCDFHHGGNLYQAARYPQQLKRLQAELAHFREAGFDEEDYRLLSAADASHALNLPGTQAALYTPHCARVHPLKLARGLARAAERAGVVIYEHSPVQLAEKSRFTPSESGLKTQKNTVFTPKGSVRAAVVVAALEGYQRLLGLDNRTSLPVFSVLCATEPLSEQQWATIGLENRETFADASRLITYGQRSADNRLVFGARGGYGFGGAVKTQFGFTPRTLGESPRGDIFDLRSQLLQAFFPALEGTQITHGWGGCLSLSRAFRPHALFDEAAGLAFVGGYGGEGVGASMLFGETLAELIARPEGELAGMPWAYRGAVSEHLRRWESEPLPWLGYSASGLLYRFEERLLCRKPQPGYTPVVSRLADALEILMS
ncbi:FAD-binding oxidoreductase [Shewanella amazonensis]|uniref:FAD dependent oxidoreductase domain-containing protein n=1 Tax=Shewanella amazonensis (strain ATCC BAA-1098 / SB2B) TaxID=326297 RepID=A1S9Q6_SHEAM|nr:FAD-dependent oxidoreductase [Shewanella amazonensis]ABM01113.1 conserved hypothetical protein [Shewanella amazonensis SB2B]